MFLLLTVGNVTTCFNVSVVGFEQVITCRAANFQFLQQLGLAQLPLSASLRVSFIFCIPLGFLILL